jgi:hypothetical protein
VTLRDFSTTYRQYRHLIDGGVADNLGVQTLAAVYAAQNRAAEQSGLPPPYSRGAVLIVIDASTTADVKLSSKGDTGWLETIQTAAGMATTNLLNRTSTATMAEMIVQYAPDDATTRELRSMMARLQSSGYVRIADRDGRPVWIVHLALHQVGELSDLPFPTFGQSVNSIATYFNISVTEAYYLYEAADLLVEQRFGRQLRRIVADLDAASTQPADSVEHPEHAQELEPPIHRD